MKFSNSPFEISEEFNVYHIRGSIDNSSDLSPIERGREMYQFDLSKVRYVNSLGCRNWILLMQELKNSDIELHNVSIEMMSAVAMLTGLLPSKEGLSSIKSFYLQFSCLSCNEKTFKTVRPTDLTISPNGVICKLVSCSHCNNPANITEEKSEFLALYSSIER